MKIRIDYCDGRHTAEPWTQGHENANLAFVEMRDDDWVALKVHLAHDRLWQDRLLYLGNWQWERDHPEQVVIPNTDMPGKPTRG